mmetsp:Transcript_25531/g.71828  ORF Transcript_25531/g.71828 Transcript_25531/m.71828 type:complete len:481 (+) Transcript_25531:175-1617(+)
MECELPHSIRPGVLVVTRELLKQLTPHDTRLLGEAIDQMGKRSMKAQGLSRPITTYSQMMSCDNRLFLSIGRGTVRGLIRVGGRQLFLRRTSDSDYTKVSPLCVLDFYVCENLQRSGEGKLLFEYMREHEGIDPGALGYDRPSPKFLAFLRKHYGLSSYTPQANFFVVFDVFWERRRNQSGSKREGSGDKRGRHLDASGFVPRGVSHSRRSTVPPKIVDGESNTARRNLAQQPQSNAENKTDAARTSPRHDTLVEMNAQPHVPDYTIGEKVLASPETAIAELPQHQSEIALSSSPNSLSLAASSAGIDNRASCAHHRPLEAQQQPRAFEQNLQKLPNEWHSEYRATFRKEPLGASNGLMPGGTVFGRDPPRTSTNPQLGGPGNGPLARAYHEKHGFASRSVARLREEVASANVQQRPGDGPHSIQPHIFNMSVGNGTTFVHSHSYRAPSFPQAVSFDPSAANRQAGQMSQQMARLLNRPY